MRESEREVATGTGVSAEGLSDGIPADVLYRAMIGARYLEEALITAANSGERVGIGHPAAGQEGVSSGVCASLGRGDRFYCGHRAKHWAVAKGCTLASLAAECLGRSDGLSKGLGGEMWIMDETSALWGRATLLVARCLSPLGARWLQSGTGSHR